jgi:dTDP-4-dehydrorhamnose reductase
MDMRRWLVTGAGGQLGGYLLAEIGRQDPEAIVLATTHSRTALAADVAAVPLNLGDHERVAELVTDWQPTQILHAGAVTAVGEAYRDPERAIRVNADGTRTVAESAAKVGAHLIYVSTDMVFDGGHAPYDEGSDPQPVSAYGRSKLAGERAVGEHATALTVRVPLMYGLPLTERPSTFVNQLAALRGESELNLFEDEFRTPIWLGDAARALVGLSLRMRVVYYIYRVPSDCRAMI